MDSEDAEADNTVKTGSRSVEATKINTLYCESSGGVDLSGLREGFRRRRRPARTPADLTSRQ